MSEHTGDIYTQSQHEKEMTRLEVQCKRWFIAFMIVLAMLFVTNAAWVIYEMSFVDVETTITQENADGYNNYIGEDGLIINNPEGQK